MYKIMKISLQIKNDSIKYYPQILFILADYQYTHLW